MLRLQLRGETLSVALIKNSCCFFLRFIFAILPLLRLDSVEHSGSEVGERGGGIRKGPQAGIRTRDAYDAMALYVGALPTRLSAPTKWFILLL